MNFLTKLLILSLFIISSTFANDDDYFHYHGLFVDQNQQNLLGTSTDSISVSLYSTDTNGVAQYTQVFPAVSVVNGAFQLKIGPSLPDLNKFKYLELNINNSALSLSPRIEIQTQAKALESNKVGGFTVEELIASLQSVSDSPNSTQNVQQIVHNFQVANQLTANHIVNESIVTKSIRLEANSQVCSSDTEGTIRYNFVSKNVEFCDGISFLSINAPLSPTFRKPDVSNSQVQFGWDPIPEAIKYRIYYGLSENITESDTFIETKNHWYALNNLKNWARYHFAVQSFDQNGKSKLSPISSISIGKIISQVSIIPSKDRVLLYWDPIENASSYTVFYDTKSSVSVSSPFLTTDIPSMSIDSLTPSTLYHYKVQANNKSGVNELSTTYHAIQLPHWTEPNLDIEMVKIPKGSFTYSNNGYSSTTDLRFSFTQDFYIGKYEVTERLWKSVVDSNILSSHSTGTTLDYPITNATRESIVSQGGFLDQLNIKVGCDVSNLKTDYTRYHPENIGPGCFRLPTNAEWEYLSTIYQPKDVNGQFLRQYTTEKYVWSSYSSQTTAVYNLLPSPSGLYNIVGNASEWVYDTISRNEVSEPIYKLYSSGVNPVLNIYSQNRNHNYGIVRGSTSHYRYNTGYQGYKSGFRLLAVVPNTANKVSIHDPKVSYQALDLTWTVAVGADSYQVTYDTSETFSVQARVISTDVNSIKIGGLSNNTTYYFKVQPIQHGLSGPTSDVVSAIPTLSTVAGLKANLYGDKISFNWDPVPFATTYEIYSSSESSSEPTLIKSTTNNNVLITPTDKVNNYYYYIKAKSNSLESAISSSFKLTALPYYLEPTLNYDLLLLPKGSIQASVFSTEGVNTSYTTKTLRLDRDIYMGKFEVTQNQWNKFMPGRLWFDPNQLHMVNSKLTKANSPAFGVGFNEIILFIDKLNTHIGCNSNQSSTNQYFNTTTVYIPTSTPVGCYRLPTEEEWEYMSYTNVPSSKVTTNLSHQYFSQHGWYDKNSNTELYPVGQKAPNGWGFYDTIGNVSEFVLDTKNFNDYYKITKGGHIQSQNLEDLIPNTKNTIAHNRSYNFFAGFRLVYVGPSSSTKLTIQDIKSSYTTVSFAWNKAVNAKEYIVTYDTSANLSQNPVSITTHSNQIDITELNNATKYFFSVKVIQPNLSASPSEVVSATPNLESPNNIATNFLNDSILITWSEVPFASSYDIYRKSLTDSIPIFVSTTNTPQFLINSDQSEVSYNYLIKATNQVLTSDFSEPVSLTRLKSFVEPTLNYEMLLLPTGSISFSYATSSNPYSNTLSKTIQLNQKIYMGKFEVTQSQWQSIIQSYPWSYPPSYITSAQSFTGYNMPAYGFSYDELTQNGGFLDKLNQKIDCNLSQYQSNISTDIRDRYDPKYVPTGCYRLPTENEWEYMTYAGNANNGQYATIFKSKDHYEKSVWYRNNSQNKLWPVGSKQANPWGFHDTMGNTSEFVHGELWDYVFWDSTLKGAHIISSGADALLPTFRHAYPKRSGWILSGLRLVYVSE